MANIEHENINAAGSHAAIADSNDTTSVTANDADVTVAIDGTSQVKVTDGTIEPITDNDVDLGTSGKEFKNLFIDGTANIDSLVADTADINGGTADNVVIGGSTAAAGSFTTVSATTPIAVTSGGMGAATFTDGGVLLGSGTGAVTAMARPTAGQVIIGSTAGDPVNATLTAGTNMTITEGDGSITLDAAGGVDGITSSAGGT